MKRTGRRSLIEGADSVASVARRIDEVGPGIQVEPLEPERHQAAAFRRREGQCRRRVGVEAEKSIPPNNAHTKRGCGPQKSCSLYFQLIFMVQTTQDRMTHHLKMAWNAVPTFLSCDRETGWRIRDTWPKAGVWSPVIVMR